MVCGTVKPHMQDDAG